MLTSKTGEVLKKQYGPAQDGAKLASSANLVLRLK